MLTVLKEPIAFNANPWDVSSYLVVGLLNCGYLNQAKVFVQQVISHKPMEQECPHTYTESLEDSLKKLDIVVEESYLSDLRTKRMTSMGF